MKIIRSTQKEWLENKGYSKKILLDCESLKTGSLIQEIKIKAGERVEEHYHQKQTEVFYFLNNLGYWIINGEKHQFEAGDILIIQPNDKHIVVNESDKDYVYLAIKYNYEDKDDIFWINDNLF